LPFCKTSYLIEEANCIAGEVAFIEAAFHQMYIEGSLMGVIHQRLLSPKRRLLGLMKSHPHGYSMKSRFDEKPLR
jgi:hypothetical protein